MSAQKILTVLSAWTGKPVPVTGTPTPVAGLWIAPHPRGGYMVVHELSERIVGSGYTDPEAALACVLEIGPLANWGEHTHPCMALPSALIDQINGIVQRWGGGPIAIRKSA